MKFWGESNMKTYIEFEAISESGQRYYVTLQKNEIIAFSEAKSEYYWDEYEVIWKRAKCTEVIARNGMNYFANIEYDKFRKLMR